MNALQDWILRLALSAVFLLWGAVLLTVFFEPSLYLKLAPLFRPISGAAGLVFAAIGFAWPFLAELRPAPSANPCLCLTWSLPTFLRLAALVVPVILYFLVRPDDYSFTQVQNRGVLTRLPFRPSTDFAGELVPITDSELQSMADSVETIEGEEIFNDPAPAALPIDFSVEPVELSMLDLFYVAETEPLRSQLEGKRVAAIGQFSPKSPTIGDFGVIQLLMQCCLADALPVGFGIRGPQPDLPPMSWVRVSGPVAFEKSGEFFQPVLQSETVEAVDPPEEPYLYW